MNTTPESITPLPSPILPAEKILFDIILEYIQHFWLYFIVAAIILTPTIILDIWLNPLINQWYIIIINFILMMLFSYYLMLVLLLITQALQSNQPMDINSIFLISLKKYLPYAWTMIILEILGMIGALFCCIPLLIVEVLFCVANGIVVWEGINGIPALKRSFELTKPYFWRVLWILLIFYLTYYILFMVFTEIPSLFIPSIPGMFKGIFNHQYKGIIQPWWYTIYQHLIGALLHPTLAIMTYILYRNLNEVHKSVIAPSPEMITPENQSM
ncbi:MAG: hypothetical protein ACE14V_12690 [bacterium]